MMEHKQESATMETWTIGSPRFAEFATSRLDNTLGEIDEALAVLQSGKDVWVEQEIPERLSILDKILAGMMEVANSWVYGALKRKGTPPNSLAEAEEWVSLAVVFRALQTIKQSLLDICKHGRPRIPGPIRTNQNGQIVVRVFPLRAADRLLFNRFSGEVWMEPEVTLEEMLDSQASTYLGGELKGKIALVLGAGNASFLPVIDLLHKLFVEGQVVILKLNPVNAYIGPLIEKAFEALIARGFLRVVYGAVAVGSYLSNHPSVDELHLTGSDKTFESIVFGPGQEGEKRKAARNPINTRRFTGELGNVSPVIIVPGPWSKGDIAEQATQLTSWIVVNAGFACLAPRVIIQHESWPQRHALLKEIGDVLENTETRKAYYSGAAERHAAYLTDHPDARQYGRPPDKHLPWTLIADINPANTEDICFKREAFCGLFSETALEAAEVPTFIDQAVQFANDTLWGTLCATLIVHPKSLKNPQISAAVERAIADLRYGTVSVNAFAFYSAYFMGAPWGGFPGQDMYDIQSGIGKTFNFLMFEHAQKSVIRAPFKRIDPLTVDSKQPHAFGRKMAFFEYALSWWQLPGLIWTALRC